MPFDRSHHKQGTLVRPLNAAHGVQYMAHYRDMVLAHAWCVMAPCLFTKHFRVGRAWLNIRSPAIHAPLLSVRAIFSVSPIQ